MVHAYDGVGSSLSAVTDQELAAFVLWLAAGCCFIPVIFVSLITWLRDGADPGEEPASPVSRAGDVSRASAPGISWASSAVTRERTGTCWPK